MSTPHIKFEHSPADSIADSFVSTPGTQYPSLFGTMDPQEVMTPPSFDDESIFGDSMRDGSMAESLAGTPAPEKKPVKKRKSWGQQLPEPKTNLPPRKRAKTEDEKEQRRVERVLRNRRAAQSSRERKRQEVEALEAEKRQIERRNQDLEMRLADMEAKWLVAQQQIEQLTGNMAGGNMAVFRGSSVASSPRQCESLRQSPTPVTFSQELFTSQDAEQKPSVSQPSTTEILQPSPRTVNPASLSPEMRPVTDASNASSSDMTQHPAAVLCDLQCQSEEQRPWTSVAISQLLAMMTLITMASDTISTLLSPLSQILDSLNKGSSLSPTPSILTTIIWMATTTAALMPSTSTISSTTTRSHSLRPKFSLRIQLLRRLLSCSPNLARPLMDATKEAMRLASEQQLARDCLNGVDLCDRLDSSESPSVEALMTLLWVTRMIEKEEGSKSDAATEARQACGELDTLFSAVKSRRSHLVSGTRGMGSTGQKSLEEWRPEF